VLAPGEEEGDAVTLALGHDARGEDPRPLRFLLPVGRLRFRLGHQLQDLRRRVVVVQKLPLRRLVDQLLMRGHKQPGGPLDHFPLGRRRQWDAQVSLQLLDAVEGHPRPVLEQPHHARRRLVVLLVAHTLGGIGHKHLAAQVAAQLLTLVQVGAKRRHPCNPYQHRRRRQHIHLALLAFGASIPTAQRRV
jgi:hypothetical protein